MREGKVCGCDRLFYSFGRTQRQSCRLPVTRRFLGFFLYTFCGAYLSLFETSVHLGLLFLSNSFRWRPISSYRRFGAFNFNLPVHLRSCRASAAGLPIGLLLRRRRKVNLFLSLFLRIFVHFPSFFVICKESNHHG